MSCVAYCRQSIDGFAKVFQFHVVRDGHIRRWYHCALLRLFASACVPVQLLSQIGILALQLVGFFGVLSIGDLTFDQAICERRTLLERRNRRRFSFDLIFDIPFLNFPLVVLTSDFRFLISKQRP